MCAVPPSATTFPVESGELRMWPRCALPRLASGGGGHSARSCFGLPLFKYFKPWKLKANESMLNWLPPPPVSFLGTSESTVIYLMLANEVDFLTLVSS